jgi:hypothetical protein
MELFRPPIADSAVRTAVMARERDFVRVGGPVALSTSGRKGFFQA